jgi:hypothetical protein
MIHLIFAPPSKGKSYIATYLILQFLKDGKRVFSNYPVIYKVPFTIRQRIEIIIHNWLWFFKFLLWLNYTSIFKSSKWECPLFTPKHIQKELSPLKWKEDYIFAQLTNCKIVLDEAYMYFNSHKRSVEDDVHKFFATTGHNDVDVFLLAQHYNRINLVIREIANYYIWIEKTSNPFSWKGKRKGELTPLFFTVEYYISEDDFRLRRIQKTILEKKIIWFNKNVSSSYNTQYYRTKEKPILPKPMTWIEDMSNTDTEKDIVEMAIKELIQDDSYGQ